MKQILIIMCMGLSACLANRELVERTSSNNSTNNTTNSNTNNGGNTNNGTTTNQTTVAVVKPDAPLAGVKVVSIKMLEFSWNDVKDATTYKLLEDFRGDSTFTEVSETSPGVEKKEYNISLYQNYRSKYKIQSCNSAGCSDSETMSIAALINDGVGYFKADVSTQLFGSAVSLSDDGRVMVVGARGEETGRGAIYIFEHENEWIQTQKLQADTPGPNDQFGASVSISGDGKTIVVGARREASNAIGVNSGGGDDNSKPYSGAAYVFEKLGTQWEQVAYLKASNTGSVNAISGDTFGTAVSISSDGKTIAIGAPGESSNSKITNQGQNDNSADNAGAVYIFTSTGSTWSQTHYLKNTDTRAQDRMGRALDLSRDGNVLIVGMQQTAYVFQRAEGIWSGRFIYTKNSAASDDLGISVSISGDGKTSVVGAPQEDGKSRGVNGDSADNSAENSGAVYLFIDENNTWEQKAYFKASNTRAGYEFGSSLSLNSDGTLLAISSPQESGSATHVNGDSSTNDQGASGGVYVFEKTNMWKQSAYLKATNTVGNMNFGNSISISGDGLAIAVGAELEGGSSVGIGGDDSQQGGFFGSVFLY